MNEKISARRSSNSPEQASQIRNEDTSQSTGMFSCRL